MLRLFPFFLTILIFLGIQLITLFLISPATFPHKKSWLLFLLGMTSCLVIPFFQNLLYALLDTLSLPSLLYLFLSSFLLSGLIEESIKLLLLIFFFFRSFPKPTSFESWKAAFSLILGFCMVENLFYIAKTSTNIFSRFLLAVPLHWATILLGSWLLTKALQSEKASKRQQWIFFAFLIPTLLHGLYNFFLLLGESHQHQPNSFIQLNNQNFFFLFCIIEVIMIHGVLFFIYRYEKKQSRSLP